MRRRHDERRKKFKDVHSTSLMSSNVIREFVPLARGDASGIDP